MIGLNPWKLEEDKFCVLWLESNDCSLEEGLDRSLNIKKAKINKLFAVKIFLDPHSVRGYVSGKWEHSDGVLNSKALKEFMNFVSDSYIVGYKGNKFLFPMINDNLLSQGFKKLSHLKTIDMEEVLDWVESETLVGEALKELDSINKENACIFTRVNRLSDFFIDRLLPVLKHGFNSKT
ncbi:hypothetical protein MHSWG343_08430 [Candidatus Mycoplasma haematohominis]|uniref:Uncharacterized protein n=1 Tax=Candidatus Mycoplasma haematohominis TaxID=1494318 RepID=A0A478FU12_9MOLU|nr:hypothetical protein MHSWG343_08430 [Candidatus Mycoplasma haemohominis]